MKQLMLFLALFHVHLSFSALARLVEQEYDFSDGPGYYNRWLSQLEKDFAKERVAKKTSCSGNLTTLWLESCCTLNWPTNPEKHSREERLAELANTQKTLFKNKKKLQGKYDQEYALNPTSDLLRPWLIILDHFNRECEIFNDNLFEIAQMTTWENMSQIGQALFLLFIKNHELFIACMHTLSSIDPHAKAMIDVLLLINREYFVRLTILNQKIISQFNSYQELSHIKTLADLFDWWTQKKNLWKKKDAKKKHPTCPYDLVLKIIN